MLPRNPSPLALRRLCWQCAAQTRVWQNTATRWTPVLCVTPQGAVAYHNLTGSKTVAWITPVCQAGDFRQAIRRSTRTVTYAATRQPGPAAQTAQQAQTAAQANNNRLVTQSTKELSRFRLVTPLKQACKEYIWLSS